MKASELPPAKMPIARYPCENRACSSQGTWPPEALRWSPGGDDGKATAWRPGFYCENCRDEASKGSGENLPTLAEELARRGGVVGERDGNANAVKLQLVGTLVCIPHDFPQHALLEARLADEGGEREFPADWHLAVIHDWPKSECLPCDLVSVEGYLTADGECDPMLDVSRVRLLRQDITGEQREQLLQCEDTVERWSRAQEVSYSQSESSN